MADVFKYRMHQLYIFSYIKIISDKYSLLQSTPTMQNVTESSRFVYSGIL